MGWGWGWGARLGRDAILALLDGSRTRLCLAPISSSLDRVLIPRSHRQLHVNMHCFHSTHSVTPNMLVAVAFACAVVPLVAGHATMIMPPPRNSIDSELPPWHNNNHPAGSGTIQPYSCGCVNGSEP